jgi:hypothetical protein
MLTVRQTIDWGGLLATGFGIFFSIILGFFVLKIALSALNLATSYGEKDALKKFKDVLTANIKGLAIGLGSLFILNTIFYFLNINTGGSLNVFKRFSEELCKLETCLRNYDNCGNLPAGMSQNPPVCK